jgi:hypothetical protein
MACAALVGISGMTSLGVIGGSHGPPMDTQRARPTLDLSQPSAWTADSSSAKVARQAQAIDPDVRGWCTFDSKTKLYTYSYRVWNRRSAVSAIWHFAIAPVPRPIGVGMPSARWSHFYGYAGRKDALVWIVTDTGPAPAGLDSVSLWPSPFDIQPGDSATGFSLTTSAPPTTVSYYAQGFYDAKVSYVFSVDERPGSAPPSFTLFQNSLTGTTIGPRCDVGR